MARRGFLAVTGMGIALAAVSDWDGVLDRVASPNLTPTGRLGRAALDRLGQRLANLRRLDDELGGTVLCDPASAELRWLTGLAESARGAEQHELLGLVAEAARLCGWLHFDAGRHAAAQAYYATGLRCSASGDHPLLSANILAGMSFQATLAGHTSEAIDLLDTAERCVGRSTGPRLRALLASRRARAYARAGDARGCGQALNRAEKALAAENDDLIPAWLYFFDEAELAAQAGACWVDLRDPHRARPVLDSALASIDDQYVRDRTIYYARSSQAYLHSDELERACAELTTAAMLVGHTGSTRSLTTIRAARREMSGYEGERAVRAFDDTLDSSLGVTV